jgi:hypothetical protein
VPIGGGPTKTLASGQYGPRSIAVDATAVYWANSGDNSGNGSAMKMPLDGGTPVTLAADRSAPISIAVDDAFVYWIEGPGTVMKISKE